MSIKRIKRMINCCVCRKEYCSRFPRQFHSFPIDAKRREKWFQSIGRNISAYRRARICSDHFTENDYNNKSKRLKKTAVPSVFMQRFCKNVKKDLIIETQHDSTSSDDQNKSIIGIHKSTMDIQHDNQNESMDILHEFPMDIQNEVTVLSDTCITESDTHITESNTHVTKNDTHVTRSDTRVTRSGTSVTRSGTRVMRSDKRVTRSDTRVTRSNISQRRKWSKTMKNERMMLKTGTGSITNNAICIPQDDDDIVLLNTILFDEYTRNEQELNEHQEVNVEAKQDSVNIYMDHDYFIRINWYLTEYVETVITYISDYIVSNVINKINCLFCKELLIANIAQKESDAYIDTLCQASCDVIEICKTAEKILKHNQDKLFKTDNILADLICQSLRALSSNIFNMNKHMEHRHLQIIITQCSYAGKVDQ
ncbi:uncharacterized protein [Mycetomoellerius zeteki]|uniref:uncharacterized protein n=1 Tax=Mycetomoellerius zeteki TaxID=64791 RepID=UPI00084E773D|nr:PREDICTED: uncharacterized protein LOC108731546 [Trachymyrmex zeteki]